jgi:hypothetical protein
MELYGIAPAPSDSDEFIELSGKKSNYRVFRKHILNFGQLHYEGKTIDVDEDFYAHLSENLKNGVCVPSVPKVNGKNQHVEDPDNNIGRVIGLSRRGDKIYADFEARDPDAAKKLGDTKTYLGASAFFSTNYTDRRSNKRVGPTLLHVAVTNRPYVTALEDYEEVYLSEVVDSSGEAVLLTATPKENRKMTRDELFAALKADYDIDVPELQVRADDAEKRAESAVALSAQIYSDLVDAELVALSDSDDAPTYEDIKTAIDTAREERVALSAQIAEMNEAQARSEADAKVQKLIDGAFITEDKREVYVKLAMTDNETYEALVPEEALVKLSEDGTSTDTAPAPEGEEAVTESELARILGHLFPEEARS